jgi:hypothetical protein
LASRFHDELSLLGVAFNRTERLNQNQPHLYFCSLPSQCANVCAFTDRYCGKRKTMKQVNPIGTPSIKILVPFTRVNSDFLCRLILP